MVKRDGAAFSTEPGNLMNKHSFKYSGLVNDRAVRMESVENGITLSRRKTKPGNKVASAYTKPSFIKASTGHKNVAAKVERDLNGIFYRRDLIAVAKARAVALIKAQQAAKKN